MENLGIQSISAVLRSEKDLEEVFQALIECTVARHDISIETGNAPLLKPHHELGLPTQNPLKKTGFKQEAFLSDDYGWVLGFSFSIPVFIGVVIGVFLIGDIYSTRDNLLFGVIGAIIGAVIGALFFNFLGRRRKARYYQDKEQGYVIWINVSEKEKIEAILSVLKKYKAKHIKKHYD